MTDSQCLEFNSASYGNKSRRKDSQPEKRSGNRASSKMVLNLPPPGAMRWGARNKAAVVTAIRSGALSLDDACRNYALSTAEYLTWEASFDALGIEGLGMAGRQLRRRALNYGD